MRRYKGIDAGRLMFACFIPLLHIPLPHIFGVEVIQQYIARLGVPYFYAVSGMFLSKSLPERPPAEVCRRYASKIARLLCVWLAIYAPIMLLRSELSLRSVLFLTPGYLWYLMGSLVATVPFCMMRNRKLLYTCAAALYITGTLLGGSYKWALGGWPEYERIFLTTRNGIFFALPMMCVGELIWKKKKASIKGLLIAGIFLVAEITIVGIHAAPEDDRSMYLCLPFLRFFSCSC